MKLGTLLYLPKNYLCAKFGCCNLIHDLTMTSSMFFNSDFEGFTYVVNQVLFRYKNVASVFI